MISLIVLFAISCKDANKIKIESIIDEFEYLKNNNLIQENKLQNIKTEFENLSYEEAHEIQVSALYYLSEIAMIENKIDEAYNFINQAYEINHADSIYKQLHKLEQLLTPKDELLKIEPQKEEIDFKNIFEIGRNKIKILYKNKNYSGAISQTQMLIEIIKSLKEESKIKVELAQLYQDLAIFYSQEDKIEKAKSFIEQAIILNPTAENLEIQKLINQK